jgi:NADPH:quinone reductase-like Zn-dependent oxidoreductase
MKAAVYSRYGGPDVLKIQDAENPVPGIGEILVRISTSSVNAWDWDMVRGQPFLIRMWGLFRPKYKIPGADVAGIVETAGRNVKRFKPGDRVFGDLSGNGWGAFAEYVCAPESALTRMPDGLTFKAAAAAPQAAVIALQAIRDYNGVRPGQKVLINGAGGGVGTFAIQLAKLSGAEVTAVDSGIKQDVMRSAGADHLIDYARQDFTRTGERYDLILDLAAHHPLSECRRALTSNGRYLIVGGATVRIFQTLLLGSLLSVSDKRRAGILAHKPNKNLAEIGELLAAGKIVSLIDREFSLDQTGEAFRYFASGKVRGKVVITIDQAKKA